MKTSFVTAVLTLSLCCTSMAKPGGLIKKTDYRAEYKDVPTSISAPATPSIPRRSLSIEEFGGKGDGMTMNTEAFRKAVTALSDKGGGHLVVPAGIYLTGPIVLKDRIDLHLERNAVILFSPDKKVFLRKDGKGVVPCLSASRCKDIIISGEGIIDGNGEWWRGVKRSKVSDVEWKDFRRSGGTVSSEGDIWYPFNIKGLDNIAESAEKQEKMRTHLIRLTSCERVLIKGVTVQNSPKFHIVPQRCKDVVLDGVTVRCPWNAQNGDGIDLMQCRNALVTRCKVDVGDDGICLKAGAGAEALQGGPCQNILIQDNTVFHAHGGFVIGSEFSGGMKDIVVRRNAFSGTDTGLRFKSGPGRGGVTSNIIISDIMMDDIRGEAIVFEAGYVNVAVGNEPATSTASDSEDFIPEFTDIRISRVFCSRAAIGVAARGSIQTIHDITLEDSILLYTDKALDLQDTSSVTIAPDVSFTPGIAAINPL